MHILCIYIDVGDTNSNLMIGHAHSMGALVGACFPTELMVWIASSILLI